MFCSKCGTSLQSDAGFCSKCGQVVSAPAIAAVVPQSAPFEQGGAIWNPDAASNWSIIFSPAFGSYLHALNWRTLGEPEKEKSAMGWFYFSLAMIGVYFLMVHIGVFMEKPEEVDGAARGLSILYLLVWYFSAGRVQAKYVKEKFGSSYPRRAWGKPLLIGVAAFIGFFVLALLVNVMIGVMAA